MRENMRQKYPLLHKIGGMLLAAAERVAAFARKAETLPGKVPEIFVLLVYTAAHLGMAVVHEPFFDEAEAWQIARSVTLKTLFLETTHYEGHPPLWHLILMPFAKAGAPYELSLTLVSLTFMGTAVFLILWYAPFPRLVRLLLPFTYFFFYQYGVISRVYCVMTLAFVLLAIVYRRRNERPGMYVAVLALMCMTLAYGLIIAGGLAIVWLWEIWNENRGERLRRYVTDRRIWWLAVLLAAAIGVIGMIVPRADTYAIASTAVKTIHNPFALRLLYMFLVLPADAALTDIYSDHAVLSQAYLMPSAMVGGVLIGVMFWSIMLYCGRKKGTTLLLVLPYSLFAVFSAAVYFSFHHIGIGLLYFCFWCWVTAEGRECTLHTEERVSNWKKAPESSGKMAAGGAASNQEISTDISMVRAMQCAVVLLVTLAMFVSLYWAGAACVWDIGRNYAPGRNEAAFIKEHHLERYRMMSGWVVEYDTEGNIGDADINMCDMAVNLAPYFEHNLFFNFNGGRDDRNYITHIRLSEEETQKQFEIWRQEEPPQVLWMMPDLWEVYAGAVNRKDYALVYQGDAWQVWKAGANYFGSSIYVSRDLLEEADLCPLEGGKRN